ncbi:MAG: NUDIX hydrolase [bacterium]|nr:NUDIX hydrolase [bacterium]
MWKKVATKTLLEHPRVTIVEDEVLLPNGHRAKYLRFENLQDGVVVLAKNDQNEFLILKEYSYPPNEWLYQFPGGLCFDNEKREDGANRELMEETNLKANYLKILGSFYTTARRSSVKTYVILAREFSEKITESDIEEEIEMVWVTEEEIDKLIKEDRFKNGPTLSAWCIYKSNKFSN